MAFNCDKCGLCCRQLKKSPFLRNTQLSLLDRGDGVCRHLKEDNTCAIYEKRPLICNVDKLYDCMLMGKMSREQWYRLQEQGCKKLKEQAGTT